MIPLLSWWQRKRSTEWLYCRICLLYVHVRGPPISLAYLPISDELEELRLLLHLSSKSSNKNSPCSPFVRRSTRTEINLLKLDVIFQLS